MLRDALLDAAALLLPVACAGCGADDRALCDACRAELTPAITVRLLDGGMPVHAGLVYEGVARAVVLALKEESRTGLARALAPALVAAVAAAVADAAADADAGVPAASASPPTASPAAASSSTLELCAVPSTWRASRRRGFDPVRLVLDRAGFRAAPVFRAARPHAAQKTLSLDERMAGLEGVFAARGRLDGRRFVLVDDVVTTGATLDAAARALRAAGAEVLAAAVIASTPRRRGDARHTRRKTEGASP